MNVTTTHYGLQEVSFDSAVVVDKVHAEALCYLLRRDSERFLLASHSTDHAKLALRFETTGAEVDVKQALRDAARTRAAEIQVLMDKTLALQADDDVTFGCCGGK